MQWRVCLACLALTATAIATDARAGDNADDSPSRPMPAGFHRDRFGCYVPAVPRPAFTEGQIPASVALAPRVKPTTLVRIKDGFVRETFLGQDELTYHLLRARYFRQQNDLRSAATEYRLASASPPMAGARPAYHDLITRVPLSVVLYRAGRVAEARTQWRTILDDRIADARKYHMALPSPPAAVELLAQGRLDALADREGPRWGAEYEQTGAGQHTARGLEHAKQRHYAAAAVDWRCAAKASPEFQLPHLMLGYAAALDRDRRTARTEWIAVLEGGQSGPGDMLTITAWQYDALEALLRHA